TWPGCRSGARSPRRSSARRRSQPRSSNTPRAEPPRRPHDSTPSGCSRGAAHLFPTETILMTIPKIALALVALAGGALVARADVIEKKTLTRDGARKIAMAAEAAAKKQGVGVVIAVVDDGGHLLVLERLDNTQVASVEVGIGKARTAAIFRRPTKEFEDGIAKGRTASLVIPGATPLQGGIPIRYQGTVIGAIGVSGDTPATDEEIAKAGAAVPLGEKSIATTPVTYLEQERVDAAFAKGMPLIETPSYKIHASRRTEPGLVEVHADETDVVYVLEGEAT